ncbi:hypothetical protein L1887_57245 [Cichorium endivia]|nr:hypothetical protein L1887_57245 [Cichorium endivia]
MADAAPRGRGGFGRDRGGRGRRGPRRGGRRDGEKEEWVPVTSVGRLVKDGKIKSIEEIYLFSLPIKEFQIIDLLLPKLKDEVMKIMPVQKADPRRSAHPASRPSLPSGDSDGHLGLGVKCAKEVATAIRGAIVVAKLSTIPVRRGYWGNALGEPHTVPMKVSGKTASVMCRLVPLPAVPVSLPPPLPSACSSSPVIEDCYTQSAGQTATMGQLPQGYVRGRLQDLRFPHPQPVARHCSPPPPPTSSSPRTSPAPRRSRSTKCSGPAFSVYGLVEVLAMS